MAVEQLKLDLNDIVTSACGEAGLTGRELDEIKGTMWTLSTLAILRKVPLDDSGAVEEVVLDLVPLGSD